MSESPTSDNALEQVLWGYVLGKRVHDPTATVTILEMSGIYHRCCHTQPTHSELRRWLAELPRFLLAVSEP